MEWAQMRKRFVGQEENDKAHKYVHITTTIYTRCTRMNARKQIDKNT